MRGGGGGKGRRTRRPVEFLSTTGERMAPTVPLLPTPVVPAASSRGGSVKSTHCPLRLRVPPSFGGIIFFPRHMTYPLPSPAFSTPSPSPPRCWGGFFLVAVDEGPTCHPSSTTFTPSITGESPLWQCMPYTPPLSLPVCT